MRHFLNRRATITIPLVAALVFASSADAQARQAGAPQLTPELTAAKAALEGGGFRWREGFLAGEFLAALERRRGAQIPGALQVRTAIGKARDRP